MNEQEARAMEERYKRKGWSLPKSVREFLDKLPKVEPKQTKKKGQNK